MATSGRTAGVMRQVAALLPDAFVALDAAGHVLVASESARHVLGAEAAREGAPFASARVDFRLARLAASATSTGEERELTIGDREFLVRIIAVDDPDVATLILLRDDTRVKQLERVRRDFVSNVSHELRTPVTAVQLMAETLATGGLHDPAAAEDFVHRIALEAAQMAQIVEELLELSTIESGLRPLSMQTVPVRELLSTVERLRPLAEAKNLELTYAVDESTPDILGDPGRLGQVVRNLVHNAIKFTPAGGRVTVTAGLAGPGSVRLRVSDTGVGIAPADLDRVFERFWKADSSRQRDGEGSGLGLAIVRHVVEAHGGAVTVESEPRQGTVFTVDLPAAAQPPAAGSAPLALASPRSTPR